MSRTTNLIWIDLEMTGLDPQINEIIEIATIITDAQLNILAEGPVIAVSQPDEVIDNLDDWNRDYHGKSGLIDRVKNSTITMEEAQNQTLAFIEQYVDYKKSPMCGNSICQDRRFMARQMPKLEQYFHYRNLDVSTLKELVARWYPNFLYQKNSTHQALEDIRDSIEELRHYRRHIFISS
ncbi:Oligoribonuclease [Suttonella ornithocola]|uniref:Oligoribonuclease n=2 Tax=Suttonella ornithocola TaxID=279832 RepID=A0A380MYR3_9GAMM|nr:oligoribonuclease [Suttonella ornithocola]SUO97166.1 Oligoribonuclease [Suttonella ornithocola]